MAERKRKAHSKPSIGNYSYKLDSEEGPSKKLKAKFSFISQNGDSSESDSDGSFENDSASEPSIASSTPLKPLSIKETSTTKHESFTEFLGKFNFTFDEEDDSDQKSISRMSVSTINESLFEPSKNSMHSLSQESEQDLASKGIKVIYVPNLNMEIVLMPYPVSLTLHGYLNIKVLMGSISIFGFVLNKGEEINVFSTESNMLLKASSLKSPLLTSTKSLYKTLDRLVLKKKDLVEFLEHVGPGTVVLIVQKIPFSPALKFLENYFPDSVETQREKKIKVKLEQEKFCSTKEINSVNISRDYEVLADRLKERLVAQDGVSSTSIVVYGNKRAGKSSLLRYLVNSALNVLPAVYYLDIDPGQTEFTPPGVVSLVKVTDPLLGPPYSHQQKPIKMIFTGSITPQTSPPAYIKSIGNLIKTFKDQYPNEVLFVNTMGWIKGIGGICFENAVNDLNPSVLIELVQREELPAITEEMLKENTTLFKVPTPVYNGKSKFSAVQMREFALLAYFGNCQSYYKDPTSLPEMRPFQVCWNDMAFYAGEISIPPYRLIEAVQSSVVALCCVKTTLMLQSNLPQFPKTLFKDPHNVCLGYGLVRSANEAKHMLHIITPLKENELIAVNAIIKGNIILPHVVYLKQEIRNKDLPYTDAPLQAPTSIRKTVSKRARRSLGHQDKN